MSVIKDLVDLVVQLKTSCSDRKTLDALRPIEKGLLDAEKENFALQRQHADEVANLQATILKLQAQQDQRQINEQCPYCQQITGVLEERKRARDIPGAYFNYYKCQNCQKTYEKQVRG